MKVSKTLKRYILIGLTVYAFELLVLIVADWQGASPLLAVSLSFWLGLIVSFLLQKLVTFKDKRMHKKIVVVQFLAACVLVLWNYLFTLAVTSLLKNVLPPAVTRTLALGTTTIWNFYIYKTRVFKNSHTDPLVS